MSPATTRSSASCPRQGLGIVTLSTTENLGQLRTLELTLALLRDGGVFDAPSPAPSFPLVSARDNVLRLLAKWDPQSAARIFDWQSMQYSFLRHIRPDFERMGREQGPCQADGDIVPLSLTHGRFRLACERGSIDFVAYLTPAVPPVLQAVEYRQNLPVTDKDQTAARTLIAALNGTPLPRDTLAPTADRSTVEKRLARLHTSYGPCALEAPVSNDAKGQATFLLRCAEAPLELTLRLDPETSLIADVSGAQPRSYGAVCTE